MKINTVKANTRYFKCPVYDGETILFIKPPKNRAIGIYIYHGNNDRSFGVMGHIWTLKEILNRNGVQITKNEADALLKA